MHIFDRRCGNEKIVLPDIDAINNEYIRLAALKRVNSLKEAISNFDFLQNKIIYLNDHEELILLVFRSTILQNWAEAY